MTATRFHEATAENAMSYEIDLVCFGMDLYTDLKVAAASLNEVQEEFRFVLPGPRMIRFGDRHKQETFLTTDVYSWIEDYRRVAKGHRPFAVAFVDGPL